MKLNNFKPLNLENITPVFDNPIGQEFLKVQNQKVEPEDFGYLGLPDIKALMKSGGAYYLEDDQVVINADLTGQFFENVKRELLD